MLFWLAGWIFTICLIREIKWYQYLFLFIAWPIALALTVKGYLDRMSRSI